MIDIEKFICSLLADHPEGVTVRGDIHRALKEQGLEYKDGKIVPIEDKTELKESRDERIRKSIIGFLITISSLKDGKTVSNKDFDTKAILEWIAWLKKQAADKPYYTELLGYFEIGKRLNHSVEEIIDWLKSKI